MGKEEINCNLSGGVSMFSQLRPLFTNENVRNKILLVVFLFTEARVCPSSPFCARVET